MLKNSGNHTQLHSWTLNTNNFNNFPDYLNYSEFLNSTTAYGQIKNGSGANFSFPSSSGNSLSKQNTTNFINQPSEFGKSQPGIPTSNSFQLDFSLPLGNSDSYSIPTVQVLDLTHNFQPAQGNWIYSGVPVYPIGQYVSYPPNVIYSPVEQSLQNNNPAISNVNILTPSGQSASSTVLNLNRSQEIPVGFYPAKQENTDTLKFTQLTSPNTDFFGQPNIRLEGTSIEKTSSDITPSNSNISSAGQLLSAAEFPMGNSSICPRHAKTSGSNYSKKSTNSQLQCSSGSIKTSAQNGEGTCNQSKDANSKDGLVKPPYSYIALITMVRY